ncbi:unnamed protein product [Bursaphelenchus okinawaensis]|uniref:Rho-GAP domain-containing protein n=1 Tax=Bursaphelenchus okinawaensis TaxID=465554 RepID=A0A811LII1_9BILA|nr:unnamed protein product [Bursaphelenchus okinawaensis]CAG9124335.1 unnamed protein product [Bursaphelenchus okinawaensis]
MSDSDVMEIDDGVENAKMILDNVNTEIAAYMLTLMAERDKYFNDILQLIDLAEELRKKCLAAEEKSTKLEAELKTLRKNVEAGNRNLVTKRKRRKVDAPDFTCSDLDETSDITMDDEEFSFHNVKVEKKPERVTFVKSEPQTQPKLSSCSTATDQSIACEYNVVAEYVEQKNNKFKGKKVRRSNSVPGYIEHDNNSALLTPVKPKATLERRTSLNVTSKSAEVTFVEDLEESDDFLGGKHHDMTQRRNFTNSLCAVCRRSISFGVIASKCQVCKLTFHQDCSRKNILPCMPRKAPKKQQKYAKLGEYCPDSRPMVPQIVGFCCVHIERSGTTLPIYQSPGNEEEVQRLLTTFLKKDKPPKLVDYGILTVAETVKRFLLSLKEPLVPLGYQEDMKQGLKGDSEMIQQIATLPQAHADTLVFLCRHLKRLGDGFEFQHKNLTVQMLSQAMAPVIFRADESNNILSNEDAIKLTTQIISLPYDDLQQMLGNESRLNRIPSDHLKRRRRSFQESPLPPQPSNSSGGSCRRR